MFIQACRNILGHREGRYLNPIQPMGADYAHELGLSRPCLKSIQLACYKMWFIQKLLQYSEVFELFILTDLFCFLDFEEPSKTLLLMKLTDEK